MQVYLQGRCNGHQKTLWNRQGAGINTSLACEAGMVPASAALVCPQRCAHPSPSHFAKATASFPSILI